MNETNDLSRAEQIQNQANQGWAKFILQPFTRILANGKCGERLDLITDQNGETIGMLIVLTAGEIPPFNINYERKPDESAQ